MKKSLAEDKSLAWAAVLSDIRGAISGSNYRTWFSKISLLTASDGQITVAVPNAFTQKQLETRFCRLIEEAFKNNQLDPKKLNYQIKEPVNKETPRTGRAGQTSQLFATQTRPSSKSPTTSETERSRLNPKYTLNNFVVGGCNDLAYAAAQGVLKNLGKKYNPLFVYGGVGTGKTHLIQAVGNQALNKHPELNVVYVTVEQFLKEFVDSIKRKKDVQFANRYRSADILIVDDVQFIAKKDKTQEELFHTFNALLETNKQMVFSSDKRPEEIPTLEARLCSRFQMGMSVDVQAPDLETRLAILKKKASRQPIIGDDCYLFLAENFANNVRELEGALKKLEAYCDLKDKKRATVSEAEVVFGGLLKERQARLTPKKILSRVADYYQLKPADLISPKRDQTVLHPRQMAMYLLRKELHLSYPKIATNLGRKDHTTAINSVQRVEAGLQKDSQLKTDCLAIQQSLNS